MLGIEKLFDDEDLVLKKEDEASAVPVKVEARTIHLPCSTDILSVCIGAACSEGVGCSWQGQC